MELIKIIIKLECDVDIWEVVHEVSLFHWNKLDIRYELKGLVKIIAEEDGT